MAKVGRFVIDPKAGAYCQIDLDDGKKILINHDQGSFKAGRMTVTEKKFWGGATFLDVNLDSPEGATAFARLTRGVEAGSAGATPLGALAHYLEDCASLDDVRAKCAALTAGAA
jgi:hypothetical protein